MKDFIETAIVLSSILLIVLAIIVKINYSYVKEIVHIAEPIVTILVMTYILNLFCMISYNDEKSRK